MGSYVFVLVVCAGAVLVHFGAKYLSAQATLRRRVKEAPLRTTADFPENTVGTVQGKLRYLGEAPLVAPLSGRPCAYYEVIVEQGGFNKEWKEIIRESDGDDFLLEDEHGLARVHMEDCEVLVSEDASFRSGTFQDATPELEAFLAEHGHTTSTDLGFNKTLRYREGVLEAGETVAVCGMGTREVDPDPRTARGGYRENASRLVLSASDEMPLYVSDSLSVLRDRKAR